MKDIKFRMSALRILLAFLTTALSAFSIWGVKTSYCASKQSFVQVAYLLDGQPYGPISAYDTDHDGRHELLLTAIGRPRIYEHIGNNQYELVLTMATYRAFLAVGDIDSDSLTDMVIQTHDSLEVLESANPDSHPGHCVWQWGIPYPGNYALTWITDLDQDGKREMLISHFGSFVYIFENTSDNAYTEVFQDTLPSAISDIATGDFDCDGKVEFVTSNSQGSLFVYENMVAGVDSFAITWTGSIPTWTAYAVVAANDMDQDGKPEFVIGGNDPFGGGRRHVFTVFEAIGDDVYESIWMDSSLTSGLLDGNRVACGDVDGDSIDEMLFGVDEEGVFLYKCTGPDTYERIWEWHTSYEVGGVLIYDLNQNGYGEIVASTPEGTWIFEKEGINESGFIAGRVTSLASGQPIEGAVVTTDGWCDTTDSSGGYFLEDVWVGTYDVTAAAFGFNPDTLFDVQVSANDTAVADFSLTHPEISVDPTSFRVELEQNQTKDTTLYIHNSGDGPLSFTIQIRDDGGWSDGFGDDIWWFDCERPPEPDDRCCRGVEFDGDYFYVTGGGELITDPNRVHFFDKDGTYITSIDQPTSSPHGWLDIAWDGSHFYSSDDEWVTEWVVTGLPDDPVLQVVGEIPGPESRNWALAYDPATDHFWTANENGPIYEFDRSGAVCNTYLNPYWVSGMAWDSYSEFAPCIWVTTGSGPYQPCVVRRFDPLTGTYDPDVSFDTWGYAYGSCLTIDWDPSLVTLFVIVGRVCHVVAHEIGSCVYSGWLEANPTQGTVFPGETFPLDLRFDATGLDVGTYSNELRIYNNSATTPVVVPCTLDVLPGVGVAENMNSSLLIPRLFSLAQNCPNPLASGTSIGYGVASSCRVNLNIYDTTGRLVRSLVNERREPGYYDIFWDGKDLSGRHVASGIYFYRLVACTERSRGASDPALSEAEVFTATRKMVLLR